MGGLAGSLPIGTVVTDRRGSVFSSGRNRVRERSGLVRAMSRHAVPASETVHALDWGISSLA
ncbi:hypothetical protein [Rubrobacter tropicus]|uniref:hypothetical protein n=1 Tax=Rubrobacter tropicus TaxID=2653851 RepID=UPI001D18A786|nr:hypothetical protein [Rubrobacter tropicus]